MTKKKQYKSKKESYTLDEVKKAENTMGDIMNQCSEEIWDIINSFPMTPAMIYGVLESIKLSVSNDVYQVAKDEPFICSDCHDELVKQEKSSPKKAKEAIQAMYG